MTTKKKILIVNASTSYGGVTALLYNYYTYMDKSKLSFDFLSPRKSSFEIKKDEIISNGDMLYGLNIKKRGPFFYISLYKKMKRFLKVNKYDIIHINSGIILYNAIVSYVAKKYSNSKVIVHAHSAYRMSGIKKIICLFLKEMIRKNADYYFSCSTEAAVGMFPKRIVNQKLYKIINNGIDPNKYLYNKKIRNSIRKSLGINNECIVLGNVARLTQVKNQKFLIELMQILKNSEKNFKLLIVGEGTLRNRLEKLVSEKKLNDSVIFTGLKENVADYYSAMDVFLLPSFSEGFGLTALEAQVNGLFCIVSDGVPNSIKVTPLAFRERLDLNTWKERIISFNDAIGHSRTEFVNLIMESQYNILNESKKLEEIYLNARNTEGV